MYIIVTYYLEIKATSNILSTHTYSYLGKLQK